MLSLKGKLNKTKKQLVDIAKSIQNNEKTLQALESRISGLEDEQTNIMRGNENVKLSQQVYKKLNSGHEEKRSAMKKLRRLLTLSFNYFSY